ncbi:MAG: DNA repair protein RadC [Proteobacteria bacterium]|nr:DNA repair protein RadC [Pseudomonadota bacterium]
MKQSDKDKKLRGIKNWPVSERPRELLLEKGPNFVSDAGLVAILLRSGIKGKDAVSLGRDLLNHFGGLRGLLNAREKDLKKIKGLGTAKVAQLLAATEIVRRQLKEQIIGRTIIHGPADVAEYLSVSMAHLKEEVFKVIYLNTANVVLAVEDLFKGTVDQSAVYPREIIKRAFELNASALIFVHNHPSGELKPSQSDLSLNQKLVKACLAVDLTPLDHLIISPTGYTSLKEDKLFNI